MKQITSIITAAVCLAGAVTALLAGTGIFSTKKLLPGQNRFGGCGTVYAASIQYPSAFYDDTNFYYMANSPTWEWRFSELYAYNPEKESCTRVCDRVSCTHKEGACSLNPLYQNNGYDLNCSEMDGLLYATRETSKHLILFSWNPLTNETKDVASYPVSETIEDSSGMTSERMLTLGCIRRLNADQIMMLRNEELYICDNNFQDLKHFPARNAMFFLQTDDILYWTSLGSGLFCYHMDTGELEADILTTVLNAKRMVVISGGGHFTAFTYKDLLYFPYNNAVYSYNGKTKEAVEVTKTDDCSDANPYPCFGDGSSLYYMLDGKVRRMNLDTKETEELPELPHVPASRFKDYLLVMKDMPDGNSDDIRCYDLNGKAVNP